MEMTGFLLMCRGGLWGQSLAPMPSVKQACQFSIRLIFLTGLKALSCFAFFPQGS